MDTQSLYALAEQQNIEVIPFPLPLNGSMSVQQEDGTCCIGIDSSVQANAIQERTHMGHELGHCITGSFYSIHTAMDCRQRHENRADKWAIQALIPVDVLDDAIAHIRHNRGASGMRHWKCCSFPALFQEQKQY